MKRDPAGDGRTRGDEKRRLEEFFRDELRLAATEAPPFEDVAAYVEGTLDAEARALFEERMADDPVLRQEVDDLRALHTQMAAHRRGRARPLSLPVMRSIAVLATAAAVAALVVWLRSPGAAPPPGPVAVVATPLPPGALSDADIRWTVASDGTVSGAPTIDARTRAMVADGLRGTLPPPKGLEGLRSGPATLMGPGAAAAFAPLAPLGVRVMADRPTFHWTAYPGARRYEVAVFDSDLRPQLASGPVEGTQWMASQSLPRGRTYLWQVTAFDKGQRVTAPAPPAPEARFEIASEALRVAVEARRAQAPASHLVAVVALVEAGLLDDAETELQALAAENPKSPEVARLQAALTSLRSAGPAASPASPAPR